MNILKRISFISVFMCGFVFSTSNIAYGLNVSPYKIPGVDSSYWDNDVPAALILNSAGDGLEKGTILYRTSHEGIDYYSPIPPASLQGTVSDPKNGKYNKWGPWDMPSNKTYRGITAKYYYAKGKLKTATTVQTDSGSGSSTATVNVGTLAANTPINILAINERYVYFQLSSFPTLQQKGVTNVARVPESKVTYTTSKVNLVYSGSGALLTNFKPLARYSDNMRAAHTGLTTGKYKNPSHAPSAVANKTGEWRFIGYNAEGEPLDNPYFPGDIPSFQSIAYPFGYPWRYTPWNKNDVKTAEGEKNPSYAYERFTIGAKSFSYDTESKYTGIKRDVINRMVNLGYLKSASDYQQRISLRTYPLKQATILSGQRRDNHYYKVLFMPLESGLRDLYMKKITVKEEGEGGADGKTVATWTCGISGGCPTTYGIVEKNKRYKVEIVLANGANSALIANKLQAQVGYMYNASTVDPKMPYSKLSNKKVLELPNKGGMYHTINSESNPFNDTFNVTLDGGKTIDIYGYVGGAHTGVDNTRFDNDLGAIRLTVKKENCVENCDTPPPPPPPCEGADDCVTDDSYSCKVTARLTNCYYTNGGDTKICGAGDIIPYSIKLFDESGTEVYRHYYGNSSPSIRKAIIPGKKYKLVYAAQYSGDDIIRYDWIDGYWRNTGEYDQETGEAIREWVPGKWDSGSTVYYSIPLRYSVYKYSGGPRDLDSKIVSGRYFYRNNSNSTSIPMIDGYMMRYDDEFIMYQYPYMKTSFRPLEYNARYNPDTCNDQMTVILNDNFDIAISNLKATPYMVHTNGSATSINYNVSYDATLTTPSYVSESDYQASINTAIKIGGNTYYVKDHLLKGTDNNRKITHIIENVPMPSTGTMTVSTNLNYDRQSYETGNYSNNSASTSVRTQFVTYPNIGSPNDTVKSPDSLNSNNPNKGGDANNNCLTPRTKNTWTSTHRKFSWSSNKINYNKMSTGVGVSFDKYNTTYKNLNEATETYQETFGIEKVLFRSKETIDNKYGSDGWVDLLNSSEKDLAIIKAGYGFELKIVTKYSTDALSKRTWNVYNNKTDGQIVSALNGKPNYGLEDIFVELPGTTSTRKILSSTGYTGTIKGLNMSKSASGANAEWTYTIKAANTLGIGETSKIYIPYETKDGDYTIKIYTPPISGATSPNKQTYSSMCDRKEVVIKVKGSATNDLNSHETQ